MQLASLLSDPSVATTIQSILDACLLAQANVDDELVPENGANRGVFGYTSHFYRKHEVERLETDAIPGFSIFSRVQRVEVARDNLRIMIVGLGNHPSKDPRTWMPQNQKGWPPTEHRQTDLLSVEGVPICGEIVFLCCLLDSEGGLESVELRSPRIDEAGLLFSWSSFQEIWSADRKGGEHEHEHESVEVEVRRGRKTRPGDDSKEQAN